MLKILEKYIVKKSEYDKLFNDYTDLTSEYQKKELVIHSFETKILAKEKELQEANETIELLKQAVSDLTVELNIAENKPEVKKRKTEKKEVKENGTKKKNSNTKTVSKRGKPKKSENS